MAEILIALTFDDGPHAAALSSTANYTKRVIDTLKANPVQNNTVGAFFVQTHAPARMGTTNGNAVVKLASDAGHVIAIHTGSLTDHTPHTVRVTKPPEDVTGDGVADGANGLESDMIRAKARIQQVTGLVPKFVRAVEGRWNDACTTVYSSQALDHVFWNVNSQDNTIDPQTGAPYTEDKVKQFLKSDTTVRVQAGEKDLVILLHDINANGGTASRLSGYMEIIAKAVVQAGHQPVFASSRSQVEQILKKL